MSRQRASAIFYTLILLFVLACPVFAADFDTSGVVGTFLSDMLTKTSGMADIAYKSARWLFHTFVLIQFTWSASTLVRRGEFGFGNIVELLIREIMFIGFFAFLLTSYKDLGVWIIGGFQKLGETMGGVTSDNLHPGAIITTGTKAAWKIFDNISWLNVGAKLGSVLPALIIAICFALIAAHIAVMTIEWYLIVPAGVILLGLGGSLWTKQYAENYLKTLMAIGMKFLCLQILVAVIMSFCTDLPSYFEGSTDGIIKNALGAAGAACVMLMAVQQIPQFASALISGSSFGSGSSLTGAMAAVGGYMMGAMRGAKGAVAGGLNMADVYKTGRDEEASSLLNAATGGSSSSGGAGGMGGSGGTGGSGGGNSAGLDLEGNNAQTYSQSSGISGGGAGGDSSVSGGSEASADAGGTASSSTGVSASGGGAVGGSSERASESSKESSSGSQTAEGADGGAGGSASASGGAAGTVASVANAAAGGTVGSAVNATSATAAQQDMNVHNLKADTVEAKEFKQTDSSAGEKGGGNKGSENVSEAAEASGGSSAGNSDTTGKTEETSGNNSGGTAKTTAATAATAVSESGGAYAKLSDDAKKQARKAGIKNMMRYMTGAHAKGFYKSGGGTSVDSVSLSRQISQQLEKSNQLQQAMLNKMFPDQMSAPDNPQGDEKKS